MCRSAMATNAIIPGRERGCDTNAKPPQPERLRRSWRVSTRLNATSGRAVDLGAGQRIGDAVGRAIVVVRGGADAGRTGAIVIIGGATDDGVPAEGAGAVAGGWHGRRRVVAHVGSHAIADSADGV